MKFRWFTGVVFFCGIATAITCGASGPSKLPRPELDANGAIETSFNFLTEREPTMSEEEYSLYESVIPMAKLQPEFALRLLEGMVGESETSAAFDLALGNVYFEQERFEDAETQYLEAVRKFPNFVRGWDNLGVLYFSTKRFAEAAPCFSKVVALGGWEARTFGLQGYCLAQSGNPVAAELAYMQAYAIEPDNPDWIEGLLHLLLRSKQFDRAEPLLKQLTKLEPENSPYWIMLAKVLISLDRKLDASVALDVAKNLGVLDAEGLQILGDLYIDIGFLPEAVSTYRKIAETGSDIRTDRLLRYARMLINGGNLDEAAALLDDLETLVSGSQKIEYMQARSSLSIAREDWATARGLLDSILKLDPLHGRALLHMAEVQMAMGEEVHAAFTLESATRVPDVAYVACLQLAKLKVRFNEFGEALTFLEKALELKQSPLIREYYSQVKALAEARS